MLSIQAQNFLDLCAKNGLPDVSSVWESLKEWFDETNVDGKARRSIDSFLHKNTSCKKYYHVLSAYCSDRLELEVSKEELAEGGRIRDYFGDFARKNSSSANHLALCCGDYGIFRVGTVEVETGARVDWESENHQWYDLKISPAGGGQFTFEYSPRSGKQVPPWQGLALTAGKQIYLAGVYLAKQDEERWESNVVLFILDEHPEYGRELLVGMQLARIRPALRQKVQDGDPDPQIERELAVSRRIAAVRKRIGAKRTKLLEAAAKQWVDEDPAARGTVVTLRAHARQGGWDP